MQKNNLREEVETLANDLGLKLHLEESHTEARSVREGESELRGTDVNIEGSSSGEEQQLVQQQQLVQRQQQVVQQQQPHLVNVQQQGDGLNCFARQLEEQLSSCHRETPLEALAGVQTSLAGDQTLPSELVDDTERKLVEETEKLLERKELVSGNFCQECTAVLPSGSLSCAEGDFWMR